MGASFSTIFEVALGDVTHEEAGSASGSLSAVQQLAAAIGSAIVTTVFFDVLRDSGGSKAMTISVLVVATVVALCLGLVWLLPRTAPVEDLDSDTSAVAPGSIP
jgi:MFS family permease